ncbi:MAG: AAA family ATPase [Clostridia bacterium]|nr:AAA family ATPase [Clostridia bacterium]
MRQIPYGEANFEAIIKENCIYVDKTMYIEKLEANPNRRKTIYLRPRRFGKSLFTSMLTNYYSVDTANKFENLFKGLYIYENPTPNKNNYYVLNFNFSGMTIMGNNINEEGKSEFCNKVRNGIKSFINKYNLKLEAKGDSPAQILDNLLVDFQGLNLNNKIYIIVDEYDNFTNAILKGDAQDFLELVNRNGYVRAFYEVIKEKLEIGTIERFFATGVMPVTLDNLTSGFNIATNLSTNPEFASMIGFTHEEVKEIVKEVVPEYDVEKVYEDLKSNYDGYRFSEESEEKTFNSTLVMYYLSNYSTNKKAPRELMDVNMNTSGDKIQRMVELVNPEKNYKLIEQILLNNKVDGTLKQVVLDKNYTTDDLLTMLFHLGYITIKEIGMNISFTIPNYITSTIYSEYLANLLKRREEYQIDASRITTAIVNLGERGNINSIVEIIKDFLKHSSTRDLENFNEKNLKHLFAMFLSLSKQYEVYGEFPAGQGFADILVRKTSSSMAKYEAVIELKYLSKQNARKSNKKKLIKEAKEQLARYIEDKRLNQRVNLKKYVIIFIGFEEVILEEI